MIKLKAYPFGLLLATLLFLTPLRNDCVGAVVVRKDLTKVRELGLLVTCLQIHYLK